MIAAAAPVRVRDRLRAFGSGQAPLVHRGPDAVYVDVGGWCVGVVGTRATAVPCALRTSLDTLPAVTRADVVDGVLHLDREPVVVGRIVDVRVPRLTLVDARAPASLETTEVREQIGRGDGLTPYGDDVLCGRLAVHRAAGVATPEVDAEVRAHLHRTTLLSSTLLDCAMHGEAIPEFAAYLAAVGTPAEDTGAATLAAVGHSSGRGLLEGARLALRGFEARCARTSTNEGAA